MAAWAKGAVEKMLLILKVSMCEAEDAPAAGRKRKSFDGLSGFIRSHTVFVY